MFLCNPNSRPKLLSAINKLAYLDMHYRNDKYNRLNDEFELQANMLNVDRVLLVCVILCIRHVIFTLKELLDV